MNILWISLYPPLPLKFGGAIDIYKRFNELRKYNDIYLFYINEENDYAYDETLKNKCKELYSYPRNVLFQYDTLKNIFFYPYTAATRVNKKMKKDIDNCIRKNKIDLINIEFPQMCLNIMEKHLKYNIPISIYQHNNEWDRFYQMSFTVNGMKRYLYRREAKLLYKLEKLLINKKLVDLYTFVSDKDMDKFEKEFNIEKNKLKLIPVGADYEPLETINDSKNKVIMFCGAMDSELNEEAVIWFSSEIFPLIKINIKNVKFYIVGKNPSNKIKQIQSENIIVTGTVEDVKDYYRKADLVVVPILHGGGVKVKLLEAIGYGKNIVTTPVGIEGTKFDWIKDIIVKEKPSDFADACIRVLTDSDFAAELRSNAEKCFLENYKWDCIGRKYNKILHELIKDRRNENKN